MFGGFGASAVSSINPATVQEITLQLSGGFTAEAQTGGIQSNVIVRDGGNDSTARSSLTMATGTCSPTTSTTSCALAVSARLPC